ncbi:MAG: transposase [Ignavibacteria bacterium]|nr:transposase [Ignavibacteria bacterium]
MPANAKITDGNVNERTILREFLSPNKLYTLDAGYREYKLFQDIINTNSSFVARLQDNVVWDTIEHKPLTDDDKKAGVQRDMVIRLGSEKKQNDLIQPVRVIEIFHKGDSLRPRKSRVSSKKTFRTTEVDYTLLLATDRMDLSAEIIALIYRYRWQIELFFRWFKCILGCIPILSLFQRMESLFRSTVPL